MDWNIDYMFRLIKQVFTALLSFVWLLAAKMCVFKWWSMYD